jgi:hypothetical protein
MYMFFKPKSLQRYKFCILGHVSDNPLPNDRHFRISLKLDFG